MAKPKSIVLKTIQERPYKYRKLSKAAAIRMYRNYLKEYPTYLLKLEWTSFKDYLALSEELNHERPLTFTEWILSEEE